MELSDFRMHDGSRHFATLPQRVLWREMGAHIATLPGASAPTLLTNHISEGWIDFTYKGYKFALNDQFGDYWFFVDDPGCPNEILLTLLEHCETILGPSRT